MNTAEKTLMLGELFKRANEAAIAADPGDGLENDGGTCNFDTPGFKCKHMRMKTVRDAAAYAGVGISDVELYGTWFLVRVELRGQAARRTKMMEAAQEVLVDFQESGKLPGFEAIGYYQAD
jgi:hypothetical protein